jgi:YbbR-like protein
VAWRDWTRNAGAKVLSFVVAVVVWFTVTNRIEFDKTLVFPVEYVNRPAGLTSIDPLPNTVKVRVRGKGKFLGYKLRDGVCRVDLSGYQIGRNQLMFSGDDVVLPDDVDVSRVEVLDPRRASVEFDETVIRDIAITPTVVGTPDSRYTQVGKTFLSPAKARVKGPRRLVDEITLLTTQEIDIGQKKNTIRKQVRLVPPESKTVEVTPMTVDVGITIEPVVVQRIENVTLECANAGPPGTVVFHPAVVTIEVEGARSIIDVAAKEVTSLLVRADKWRPGEYELRFKEFRDRDVVLSLARRVDEAAASPAPGKEGRGTASRPDSAVAASGDSGAAADTTAAPGPQYEPTGVEVVGRLPLPREVDLLSLAPERLTVEVLTAEQRLARSDTSDSTP